MAKRKLKTPYSVEFKNSTRSNKKMMAIFYNKNDEKLKTTHFGGKGYEDYTIHKDEERKERYISRHKSREKWGKRNMMTAGALSRWILWEKETLEEAKENYRDKFGLEEKRI